jgi:hypothetical protein
VSEDYQSGEFEDGSVLPEEEFQESLRFGGCFAVGKRAGLYGIGWRGISSSLEGLMYRQVG